MCQDVKRDKRRVFHSPVVKQLVTKTSKVTGLPEMYIMPFVSYSTEHASVDPAIDLLALRSMLTLLNFASDAIATHDPQDDDTNPDVNPGNEDTLEGDGEARPHAGESVPE